jgi:hypothetical protein
MHDNTMHHKPKCQPTHANDNKKLMPLQRCMLFYFTLDASSIIKGTKMRMVLECGFIVLCGMLGWHALLFHTGCIRYYHGQQNKDGP